MPNRRVFSSKPKKVFAFQFLGEAEPNLPWLKVCGIKLPKEDRVGKFWNCLHDTELEVEYGDWVICHDMDDLYPIKNSVLFRDYMEEL